MIIITLVILVLLKHNTAHNTSWGATTSEEFELGKTLLWQNIEPIQGHPAAMREPSRLLHQGRVEWFVCQLNRFVRIKTYQCGVGMKWLEAYINHNTARRALQPMCRYLEVWCWLSANAVSRDTRDNDSGLFEI